MGQGYTNFLSESSAQLAQECQPGDELPYY